MVSDEAVDCLVRIRLVISPPALDLAFAEDARAREHRVAEVRERLAVAADAPEVGHEEIPDAGRGVRAWSPDPRPVVEEAGADPPNPLNSATGFAIYFASPF